MVNVNQEAVSSKQALIWQGYHHAWEYNHRVNRLGSFVDYQPNGSGEYHWVAGHTAASGTGNDTAHFTEYSQVVEAEGVAFQPGVAEVIIECERTVLTPFHIRVKDVRLAEELHGRDKYVMILNGFDLYALNHSEKLITFDLEMDDPAISADGKLIRFNIMGNLCFDCRSPECQLLPMRLEIEDEKKQNTPIDAQSLEPPKPRKKRGIDKRRVDKAAKWFKQAVVRITNMEDVKRSVIGDDTDTLRRKLFRVFGKTFFLKLLKWRLMAQYKLHVHYLIIAGDADAFHATDSALLNNQYQWDLENEIYRDGKGVLPIAVGNDAKASFAVSTLGFKSVYMNITIDEKHGTEDPIQWGKGMHFLEWDMALRNIQAIDQGASAELDLFYKCWSEAMNEVITLTTWGAFRGAGRADFEARLTLLQFKQGKASEQIAMPGTLYWPGGGLSAVRDPRAKRVRPIEVPTL